MEAHASLLLHWNERLHLTSVTDPFDVVRRHFAESLLAAPWVGTGDALLDLGTGGGFPGLPLHMARGDGSLLLVESSTRKSVFLETVVSRCRLTSARVINRHARRVADLSDLAPIDVLVTRAVTDPHERVAWLRSLTRPGGRGIFFVGDEGRSSVEREAKAARLETAAVRRIPSTKASWLVVIRVPG